MRSPSKKVAKRIKQGRCTGAFNCAWWIGNGRVPLPQRACILCDSGINELEQLRAAGFICRLDSIDVTPRFFGISSSSTLLIILGSICYSPRCGAHQDRLSSSFEPTDEISHFLPIIQMTLVIKEWLLWRINLNAQLSHFNQRKLNFEKKINFQKYLWTTAVKFLTHRRPQVKMKNF